MKLQQQKKKQQSKFLHTKNKEKCFELGFVTKLHGLKGGLILHLDVDEPFFYEGLDVVFLEIKGQLVPYFIESINIKDKKAIVFFEDIETLEDATELKGAVAWLPVDTLPKLQEGQFYFHDVIGFEVIDKQSGNLGLVQFFNSGGAQDLMIVDVKGVEVIVPVVDGVIVKADLEAKKLYVDLPEGLLDVYLDNSEDETEEDKDS